jgi:hypothetical protein
VPWRVEDYVKMMGDRPSGRNEEFEREMKEEFPPGTEIGGPEEMSPVIDQPCTIVDASGNILLWHLPDIVSKSAEVRGLIGWVERFLLTIPKEEWKKSKDVLEDALKRQGRGSTWRNQAHLFKEGLEGHGGILNWSPAWFQAAHHVRFTTRQLGLKYYEG